MLLQKLFCIVLLLISGSKGCAPADNEATLICTSSDFESSLSNATRTVVLKKLPTTTFLGGRHHRPHFPQVKSLEISETSLDIATNGLRGFGNLETLQISNVSYPDAKEGAFTGLHKLHTLNISSAGLQVLHPDSFKHLKRLEVLQLSRNGLTSLIGGVFAQLHRLRTLHLDHNRISIIASDSFLGLRKLATLTLTNNSLTAVNAAHFNALPHLERLQIDFNKINAISGGFNLTRLVYIGLNDNELTSLPEDLFANATSLRKIDLYNNGLASLTETAFLKLSKLKHVNLIGNGVDVGNFQQLSERNVIRLS